ncbi:right-handed parallel beta-helix repeat-containing protein [Tellurirhabdus bombi]|uniref:right-handed parallel beta-helix repeat-containing protein n=1 Tax=Tellurirhabdus bombi TaxID=2907205 RepID=UPI001F411B6E|nr:right-handed parallel beta-helix repeat-containing protein [Tellurirhabdus bombi]
MLFYNSPVEPGAKVVRPRKSFVAATFALPGRLAGMLVAAIMLVTSCTDPEVNPDNTLRANAGPDQQVQVGQPVNLDGSTSQDSQSKPFTFQWTITQKPAKSTVTLTGATTAKPTFVPDEVGDYEVELTVTNADGKSTDKVVIAASVSQPITLDKNITVKTVLEDRIVNPNLPDYIVPKDIAVEHELTIQPGVVIAFERDVRMNINDKGSIVAKGTPEKRIRFVGVGNTKGYWVGIMLYSGSNVNVMEYVDVLHAGSRTLMSGQKAGMAMFGNAQVALENSLFTENDGYGLYAPETASLRTFVKNTFTKNKEAGIAVDLANVEKLDAESVFTGENGRNVVEVSGYYLKKKEKDQVSWGGFKDKTPYRLMGSISVQVGWKLNPGVTIEVARDVAIMIEDEAYMTAKGTATDKIKFTSATAAAAYWKGILSYSTSTQNIIENAEISNAGSVTILSGKKANVALYGAGSILTIKNTKISGSGGYGIFEAYGTAINKDAATANTFEGNAQGSVLSENK